MRFLRTLLLGLFVVTVVPVAGLREWSPPFTAFMLHARIQAWMDGDEDFRLRQCWVPFAAIAPEAALAVVAAEDQWFNRHFGFDLNAMEQALRHNEAGGKIRGASTLSQQTAKNLFLYPGKSYIRKVLEAWFTVLLELMLPKQRILEIYLNIAQFGLGIYGVEAASQHFFHKQAASLTSAEAALLAAVLPNPIRLRVDQPTPYLLGRQAWILRQMKQLGGTTYLQDIRASAG